MIETSLRCFFKVKRRGGKYDKKTTSWVDKKDGTHGHDKMNQKWFHPGSNRGPSLRKSDVITNYTMKPLSIKVSRKTYEKISEKTEAKAYVGEIKK